MGSFNAVSKFSQSPPSRDHNHHLQRQHAKAPEVQLSAAPHPSWILPHPANKRDPQTRDGSGHAQHPGRERLLELPHVATHPAARRVTSCCARHTTHRGLSPVTQQALQHQDGDGQPHVWSNLFDVDVRHKLVELPQHMRAEGEPESEADEVEVVVGGHPKNKLQEERVCFTGEKQDDQNRSEEEGADAGHAVPLHFVPFVPVT
jgi:hypothetical protein